MRAALIAREWRGTEREGTHDVARTCARLTKCADNGSRDSSAKNIPSVRADERSTSSRNHPCGFTCGRKIQRIRDMYFQPIGCTIDLRTCHSCIFAHATAANEIFGKLFNIAYEALCLADTGQTNTSTTTHRNLVKKTQETPARKSKNTLWTTIGDDDEDSIFYQLVCCIHAWTLSCFENEIHDILSDMT